MSPYITREKRKLYDHLIFSLVERIIDNEGNSPDGMANYVLTAIVDGLFHEPSYRNYARGMAALECAKLEFYRRRVAPYEDKKMAENGDVYGP